MEGKRLPTEDANLPAWGPTAAAAHTPATLQTRVCLVSCPEVHGPNSKLRVSNIGVSGPHRAGEGERKEETWPLLFCACDRGPRGASASALLPPAGPPQPGVLSLPPSSHLSCSPSPCVLGPQLALPWPLLLSCHRAWALRPPSWHQVTAQLPR